METAAKHDGAVGRTAIGADALIETVRQLAAELHPGRAAIPSSLDARLEQDYGFDSLGRVELFVRIDQRFGVSLAEAVMASAETPRDLLRAMFAANPAQHGGSTAVERAYERAEALATVTETPEDAVTLPQVLAWHVERHRDRPHIVLQAEDGSERTVTYAELDQAARAVAAGLIERGLEPGHAVAIMLPTGVEYFFSFFGILLAGGIPVPIYPPARPSQIEDHLRRHAGILSNALTRMLITVPQAKALALLLKPRVDTLKEVITPAEAMRPSQAAVIHPAKPQDIAMLQYTSGSTGDPKGVVLTHANLLINIRAMGRALRVTPADVFVSWLPLYHDMGLIGAWMGSLVYGFKYPVMSPLTFLSHPHLWLRAIHRHGGTLSGGPNFCYELCLRRIQDADVEGLDLSSWRFAFNGAEPVSPDTMDAFIKRFAPHRFRREAMAPVYGLAEATLGVAFPPPERGPLLDRVDREQFTSGGRAVPAAEGADALTFVACGVPVPGHQLRVVDPSGRELPERSEGHIQFSGPSVTSGYFRNPEATADLLDGEWMNTGDYGYVAGGDIHISGRIKDTIIRAGRNIHPYELEEAVGNLDGIRKGCVAVFGSRDARSGTEKIVVLAETRETDAAKRDSLRASINELGMTVIGMAPDDVMLAPPNTVLKTSSGKIRRTASREVYEGGGAKGTRAVWLQLVRLAWSAVLPQLRRMLRTTVDWLYGAYALFLLGTMGALVWIGCALFPDQAAGCWRYSRRVARAFLWLIGMPPTVRGVENLPPGNAGLLAINHQSYLDGILVVAALEEPRAFVAKRELLDHWVPRIFLTRIGSVFVDRLDAQRGVEDTSRFAEAVRGGLSLIVFPEGTFRRMPGVLPFRMGAFMIAAQAGTPVVPVTIRGTRSALRDGQWLVHRSRLSIAFSRPIEPAGADWNAAIRLRDVARAEILRQSGEPDLGEETSLPPKGSQPQKA